MRNEPGVGRVLVVDDEPGYRDMLSWELSRRCFSVETAVDGTQGEVMAAGGAFALVISDLTMPRQDGLGLLRAIRRDSPRTAVILTTGFGTVETAVEAMRQGAFNFIIKPYDIDYLVAQVKAAMNRGGKELTSGGL